MVLDTDRLLATLATGVINIYPFAFRCSSLNREQSPLINGMSYLLQCVVMRCGVESAFNIITDPESLFKVKCQLPFELKIDRYEPIISTILHDLAMYCSSKYCLKLHYKQPEDGPDYFLRFINPKYHKEKDSRFLVMNSIKEKCRLGILRDDEYCHLAEDVPKDPDSLLKVLYLVRSVIFSRAGELYM